MASFECLLSMQCLDTIEEVDSLGGISTTELNKATLGWDGASDGGGMKPKQFILSSIGVVRRDFIQ